MEFSTIKGFKDMLPAEAARNHWLESMARDLFESFGFREIRPPMLEWTELFSRGIGQDTDIVSKEMYTFYDSKGRGMSLRPEATASVTRAALQHGLLQGGAPAKLYTMGPMFRHENPQKERYRQFHQINAELFGDAGPRSDADIVAMAVVLLEGAGLGGLSLNLNSLGCGDCRPRFREALKAFLTESSGALCRDCRTRAETNPLRVFDCKKEGCGRVMEDAPDMAGFLCGKCREHFDLVKDYLQDAGIGFMVNPRLVRGLDYYNRTCFEIQTDALGTQNAVAGGGRYDGLVKLLGGPDVPAIGFAVGVERVLALLREKGGQEEKGPELFIAALGQDAEKRSFAWALELRKSGMRVETGDAAKGLKAQMKRAGKLGAARVLILGEEELASGKGVLRDMATKEQEEIELHDIIRRLKDIIPGHGTTD